MRPRARPAAPRYRLHVTQTRLGTRTWILLKDDRRPLADEKSRDEGGIPIGSVPVDSAGAIIAADTTSACRPAILRPTRRGSRFDQARNASCGTELRLAFCASTGAAPSSAEADAGRREETSSLPEWAALSEARNPGKVRELRTGLFVLQWGRALSSAETRRPTRARHRYVSVMVQRVGPPLPGRFCSSPVRDDRIADECFLWGVGAPKVISDTVLTGDCRASHVLSCRMRSLRSRCYTEDPLRKKGIVALVVLAAVVVLFFVLSMDGAPPDDAHLILVEGPVPPDEDGFAILLDAIEAMEWPEEDAWLEQHLSREPTGDGHADQLLERNWKALSLLENATDAPHFRARMRLAEESGPMMPFRRLGQLGSLVALRSEHQLANGQEDKAFLGLLRHLELGRRFQRSGEMVDYLIGGACEVRAINQILRLSTFSAVSNLDAVARQLGDYAWEREAMENTLKREYGFVTAGLKEDFRESDSWIDVVIRRYTHQPRRTRQLFAETYSAAIEDLNEDCSAAPRAQERSKWWYLGPNFGGRTLHSISTGPLPKFISARCEDQMRNKLTQLAIALRAYRVDKAKLPRTPGCSRPRLPRWDSQRSRRPSLPVLRAPRDRVLGRGGSPRQRRGRADVSRRVVRRGSRGDLVAPLVRCLKPRRHQHRTTAHKNSEAW